MKTLRTFVVCNVILIMLSTVMACHRSYYRRQADADATRLIQEKSLDPHWSIPGYTIEIDPASRMFDPFSLDHPPMPPDDPTAAEFMREVDGKPGFPHWHANGDTPFVENPEWKYLLPLDKDGKLIVDIETAVELALLHSPDYQRELEDLYLSALAVSLERFDFESQFFLPLNSDLDIDGRESGPRQPFSSSRFGYDSGAGTRISKLGVSGSTLLVNLANSIVWQFAGNDNIDVGFGSISATLTQPLLRAAGRDVILESLTDAERGLLYNVRQLERFRRGYMQRIVAGLNFGQDVAIGSGTIAGISGVSRGAGGVLRLLQNQQSIRIEQANIASQRTLLEQFEEYYAVQRIDYLQLTQFKNSVFGSQSRLLSQQADYQTTLDSFKITLGLPPDLDVEIIDPILEPFVLIDQKIDDRKDEVNRLRTTASDIFLSITRTISLPLETMKTARDLIVDPATDQSWTADDIALDQSIRDRIRQVRETLQQVEPIYQKIVDIDFPNTERDIQNLEDSLERRRNSLLDLRDKYFGEDRAKSETPVIESEILEVNNLKKLVAERRVELSGGVRLNDLGVEEKVVGAQANVANARAKLKEMLRIWDVILSNDGKLPPAELEKESVKRFLGQADMDDVKLSILTRAGTIRRFISEPGPEVLTEINNLIIDVSLIQALARVDALTLPIVDIDWQQALEFARTNRRDWMNARGQLVDAWRDIEVSADDLESTLDLTVGGSMANLGDNPSKLRDINGQLSLGIQFDAPITRLAERNNFRASQISYQRAKRQFYQFEDRVSAQLRDIIRQLEAAKLNFEIARNQVKISVDEVQLASYDLVRPPRPGAASTQVGVQVARNLIRALQGLLNNQNALIDNWVRFEVLRRQLDLNMGTMQLDERGLWIDPIEITPESINGSMSGEFVPGMSPVEPEMNGEEIAPTDNLPPVGRRPTSNRFSSLDANSDPSGNQFTSFRSLEPAVDRQNTLTNKPTSSYSIPPATVSPISGINSSSANPQSNDSQVANSQSTVPNSNASFTAPVTKPQSVSRPLTRSLYSNFDSDLKRARTASLGTSIEKPERKTALLPSDKKVVDRNVDPASYGGQFNGGQFSREAIKREALKPRSTPKIAPFPFKILTR